MSFLARFRVLTKILAIVVLMAMLSAGMGWLGIRALNTLNEGATHMDHASKHAAQAALATADVLAVNRAEFWLALDPRAENRAQVHQVVDKHLKTLDQELAEVATTLDEQTKALLPAVTDAVAVFVKGTEETLKLADTVKDVASDEQAQKLRLAALKGRTESLKLQSALQAVSDQLKASVDHFAAVAGEEYQSASRLLTIATIVSLIFGLAAGFITGQLGIAKPMRALVVILQRLAGGEDVDMTGTERRDEIGDTAKAVNGIKLMLAEKALREAEAKIAQDRAAAEQRKADLHRLANDFEGAVGEIIETVSSASTELEASAVSLTATAEHAQELATVVAAASEEASTNVQSVAAATEELTSSVTEISRQVQDSARIASEAVTQAQRTNDRVGDLAKAASRIGDVVELINTIAGQTNLLALNATIEAARAGEAGRGFAVVASEVKALAEQTAKATGEISEQISGIQAATGDSVTAIREISSTIGKMSEIASAIASAVEEQGAATQEISRNVQQAAQGTLDVSSNITDVQRSATETGSASAEVLAASASLSSESTRLKIEVGKFLDTVRAA